MRILIGCPVTESTYANRQTLRPPGLWLEFVVSPSTTMSRKNQAKLQIPVAFDPVTKFSFWKARHLQAISLKFAAHFKFKSVSASIGPRILRSWPIDSLTRGTIAGQPKSESQTVSVGIKAGTSTCQMGMTGVEPAHLAVLDPKSSASASFATSPKTSAPFYRTAESA
jgi:hypothetical protein